MKAKMYKIECLTNMHVGNGDVNFNIIDREVEKDPVIGCPTINASGVKGALRQHFKENGCDDDTLKLIFGKENEKEDNSLNTGKVKIFSANMLARPMRTSNGANAFERVTTKEALNLLKTLTEAIFDNVSLDTKTKECDPCVIEDVSVNKITGEIFGKQYYVMESADFEGIPLPVLARNCINGKRNLWYEEIVPHETVMYFIVSSSDDKDMTAFEKFNQMLEDKPIVQFGANASIGYGVCKVEEVLSRE